jgi:hypothetical protein
MKFSLPSFKIANSCFNTFLSNQHSCDYAIALAKIVSRTWCCVRDHNFDFFLSHCVWKILERRYIWRYANALCPFTRLTNHILIHTERHSKTLLQQTTPLRCHSIYLPVSRQHIYFALCWCCFVALFCGDSPPAHGKLQPETNHWFLHPFL